MEQLLLIVQVALALGIIGLVLIQRNDQDGLSGLGGGGSGFGLISGRAKSNLLTRTTAILATLFMLNSLLLTIVVAKSNAVSLLDTVTPDITLEKSNDSTDITVPVIDKDVEKKMAPAEEPLNKETPEESVPAVEQQSAPAEEAPAVEEKTVTPEETPAVTKESAPADKENTPIETPAVPKAE